MRFLAHVCCGLGLCVIGLLCGPASVARSLPVGPEVQVAVPGGPIPDNAVVDSVVADSPIVGSPIVDSAIADSSGADSSAVVKKRAAPDDSSSGGPLRVRPVAPRGQVHAGRPPKLWWVTVRSGLVPGWGQLANGKPMKAALMAGLDAYWLYGVLSHESDRKAAIRAGDATAAGTAVDRRNFRIWMMGATAIYAMLDAYVDAHFYDYDEGWTGRIGLGPIGQPEVRLAYRF